MVHKDYQNPLWLCQTELNNGRCINIQSIINDRFGGPVGALGPMSVSACVSEQW